MGLTALLVLIILLYIAWHAWTAAHSPLSRVPGPVLARFTSLWHAIHFPLGDLPAHAVRTARKYGKLVRVRPGELMVADGVLADAVAVKLDLPKPPVFRALRMPYPDLDSVFTMENLDKKSGEHRRRRRLVFPAFAPSTLEGVEPMIAGHVDDLVARLTREIREKGKTEVVKAFDDLTLDVILGLAFGMDSRALLGGDNADTEKAGNGPSAAHVGRNITYGFHYAGLRAVLSLVGLDVSYFGFVPYVAKCRAALAELQAFAEVTVKDRILAAAEGKAPLRNDLLQALVSSTDADSGERLSEREVVAEALLFFIAGQETTASSLSFATGFMMCRGARVWRRLQAEVDAASAAGPLDHAALRSLPYLDAVIWETLRLRPIASFIARYAPEDVELGGYHIPAGTTISCSTAAIGSDVSYWGADADSFRPERFLPPSLGGDGGWKDPADPEVRRHLPGFSWGSRNCIGQSLARMQMRMVLARLVAEFDCAGWCGPVAEGVFESWDGAKFSSSVKVAAGKLWARLDPRVKGR
ncbi:cytochrome P450 [Hyaloraphidium curvatum]|nr:cytochrome P450 [Hyaloraphidium curvatum]